MVDAARMAHRTLGLATVVALTGVGIIAACGGGDDGVGKSKLPEGVRSQAIEHEACNEGGHKVEMIDVNNDGKPDIKRVYDGSVEVCRITDLNRDGKPDMFEYYDKSGQIRRREADYDDNGVVNAIEIFENGKLVRRELDTTNQGRIDTWDYFDPNTGNRIKRERDATGDGRIDQWWTYEADKVTIAMDRNGDGQPDPEATITLGGSSTPGSAGDAGLASNAEGGAPAPAPPPAPTATEPSPSPAPTSPTAPSDAGVPGKPTRGGAKR
jgi:hypothetical protein